MGECVQNNWLYDLDERHGFDHSELMGVAFDGFTWFEHDEVKYASNGDFGYQLIEDKLAEASNTLDVLGILVSETVLSSNLRYHEATEEFSVDMDHFAAYTPIEGYANLGGRAYFSFDPSIGDSGRLATTNITYEGVDYFPNASHFEVRQGLDSGRWMDWKVRSIHMLP